MSTYSKILKIIPEFENLDTENNSEVLNIMENFTHAMNDYMVFDYQDKLAHIDQVNVDIIDMFDEKMILAYLTGTIKMDQLIDGLLLDHIKTGFILKALKKLSLLISNHQVKLNDILQIKNLDNVKIRFNLMFDGNWNPIELFKEGKLDTILKGHYWNYNTKKSYKEGQITIGLIRIKPNEDLWLLFHVGKITKDLNKFNDVGYEYETLKEYRKYFGRVVVKYKNSSQTLVRLAHSVIDECDINQILPDIFDNDIFPGYENVNLSWGELSRVIEKSSWKTALQNQKGIYLITDTSNGKMYVGSAYGENMLLNRWQNYIKTRHGGNIQLKTLSQEHIENNFKYSILDIFKSTIDDTTIINRESWWKETLMTRVFGYNSN